MARPIMRQEECERAEVPRYSYRIKADGVTVCEPSDWHGTEAEARAAGLRWMAGYAAGRDDGEQNAGSR